LVPRSRRSWLGSKRSFAGSRPTTSISTARSRCLSKGSPVSARRGSACQRRKGGGGPCSGTPTARPARASWMGGGGRAAAGAALPEARDATDALLERWARRLESSVAAPEGAALAYALRSPGKRVRAALVVAAFRSAGGESAGIVGVAGAVETVHAYSLVHDDLPCMDDDDLRRGRPTTHRQFGVAAATRAGYLLVPVAAMVLAEAAQNLELDATGLGNMAAELFQAGGIEGMVGGQWLDLVAEGR